MTDFDLVAEFHKKFGLSYDGPPRLLDADAQQFREKFLLEELMEFRLAHERGDLAAAHDSLIDLVYVALGTAGMMGCPWRELFDEVHAANMRKERASDGSDERSIRQHRLDVVKPVGWAPPDVDGVLARAVSRAPATT